MKLLKYFLFIIILIASASFITELDKRNKVSDIIFVKDNNGEIKRDEEKKKIEKTLDDNDPITVRIPFITDKDSKFGFSEPAPVKWVVIVALSIGVAIGFLMVIIYMIYTPRKRVKILH